ncbi:MAG TPA: HAD family hydrolase [Hyphomicrobiaceae bacterium]|jgi:D-glycero-D-manno-heptose 1,7-bisphosphate phosphatase
MLRPGLLLDRDGIINEDIGYLHRIEDCRFIDGIFEMTRAFATRGFALAIVTNQAGIGRGLYGPDAFETLMRWLRATFADHGVTIDAVYHCPDHPSHGIGAYRRENSWRKPGPGMLLQAAADLGLNLAQSWCVGDRASDLEAGRAAGVGTLVLLDRNVRGLARGGGHWVAGSHQAIVELLELEVDGRTAAGA